MKNKILQVTMICLMVVVATVAMALYGTGYGKYDQTASTATARLDGFTANMISLDIVGTNDFFFLVNCTTNVFNTRLAAGTVMKARGETALTLNSETVAQVESICYATTNGTSLFNFIGY